MHKVFESSVSNTETIQTRSQQQNIEAETNLPETTFVALEGRKEHDLN